MRDLAPLCADVIWHRPDCSPRHITAELGQQSLVLRDQTGKVHAHWSLSALQQQRDGKAAATFILESSPAESIEVHNPKMRAALLSAQSRNAQQNRPRGRASRFVIIFGIFGIMIWSAARFGPGLVADFIARLVSIEQARSIGTDLIPTLSHLTGPPCRGAQGQAQLDRLSETAPWRIRVLDLGAHGGLILPGNLVVLDRQTVETAPTLAVIAEHADLLYKRSEAQHHLAGLVPEHWHAFDLQTIRSIGKFATSGALDEVAKQRLARAALRDFVSFAPFDTPRTDDIRLDSVRAICLD